MRRVVVTGIGALTPIGNNFGQYVEGLKNGISGAGPITRFDASLFKVRFACELKQFDIEQFMPRKDARRLDPFAQYAMVVADEAMQMSGLDPEKIDLDRAGVIWGTGIGGFETIEHDISEAALATGEPRYSPFLIPKLIGDIAPGHISIKYGFRGINYGTVSACASSTHSIIASFDYIRMGRADIMITGGSEAAITRASVGGFSAMKAMSERNDAPETASRPFDKDRDGFVLGEGGGALILEELEHAKKRGATIYGEIIGAGMTADAYHMTAPHPEGLGARNVMTLAIKDAGINPEDVQYVNVHGTSTPLGDIAETKAIQAVFGQSAYDLNISSTKSMTGHLLGGAGAIEAIACIAAINDGFIPPTINHYNDDPEFDPKLNFTFNKAQERKIDIALSNTFGFGGHNASVIVKRFL
ncbi:MAG: beta-ketoacyl-ACP synthase II [Saprospiraceae bacterium]|nr:beta-ketoacyl-ACP synthase II [Saprospiraceae bacterium]MBK8888212.1 beta-ketoacyl-ACP synthase II [Saprospiraceae bacterium]MBK9744297.1 beta-ketoacyl-ACP synthase II [Saprospiraceae bacterium]